RAAPQGRAKRVNPPPHRHILRRARTLVRAFFSHVAPAGGMRTPDQGSTTDHRHYAVLSKPDSSSHD
ncbi:TPA: hypothetical protein MG507_27035, partial [Klebsiella pneumoniae]|nr:hypothetical protein [Klebsiella pneumoniae]